MAYKSPGVTVKNQYEALANPGAFGNRLMAVIGKVDTASASDFPSFVQEVSKATYSQFTFKRPYPVLGTIADKDRIASLTQGITSFTGAASGTESSASIYIQAMTKGATSTDTVTTTTSYTGSHSVLYLIAEDGTSYTGGTDYTSTISDDSGFDKLTITWTSGPATDTKYYIVYGDSLTGTYDYYYQVSLDNADVVVDIVWVDNTTEPSDRSIYYVTLRKEYPHNAIIYTNPDQVFQDYGSALSSDNTSVGSELSFASFLSFSESAPAIMLVPYDVSTKTFSEALSELLTREEPTIITAVDNSDPGTAGTNARLIASHIADASSDTHKKFRIGLINPHFTSNYITEYKEAAVALHTRRISIVGPSKLTFSISGSDGLTREISATKYSAIVLGAMMTRTDYDVATSMTRKISRTIVGLDPVWDSAFMNLIAQSGVTLFYKSHGSYTVRDDITTEPETIMSAEPYITTISDDIAKGAIKLLDASLIGKKLIIPTMLNAVNARLTSLLDQKQQEGIITSYGKPIIQVDAADPRKISVSIPVQPIFAAKFIDITFSYTAKL